MRRPFAGLAVVLTAVIFFAACGARDEADRPSAADSSKQESTQDQDQCATVTAAESEPSSKTVSVAKLKKMSIADFLRNDDRFETFRQIAEQTSAMSGTTNWLKIWDLPGSTIGTNRDGVTVFAPTDEAFDLLEADVFESIAETDIDPYELLGHHYVHHLYRTSDFEPGPQQTWRGSGEVELALDPLTWDGCNILETDIRLSNGFVHVIGGVVIPSRAEGDLSDS